jgi:hypothetical protein
LANTPSYGREVGKPKATVYLQVLRLDTPSHTLLQLGGSAKATFMLLPLLLLL